MKRSDLIPGEIYLYTTRTKWQTLPLEEWAASGKADVLELYRDCARVRVLDRRSPDILLKLMDAAEQLADDDLFVTESGQKLSRRLIARFATNFPDRNAWAVMTSYGPKDNRRIKLAHPRHLPEIWEVAAALSTAKILQAKQLKAAERERIDTMKTRRDKIIGDLLKVGFRPDELTAGIGESILLPFDVLDTLIARSI